MALPLPFTITADPATGNVDAEAVQANFEAIKKEFPLSRKDLKIEQPHVVGAAGEPAFQGTWANWNTSLFYGARFWKDTLGFVHIQGLVMNGAMPSTIFILPAGYRPSNGIIYATDTNTGHGRVDIAASGNVVAQSGGAGFFSIFIPPFKQEQ